MHVREYLEEEFKAFEQLKGTEMYRTFKSWFLLNATEFHNDKLNKQLSIDLAEKHNSEIKSCYKNSWNIACSNRTMKFYEGYIWDPRLPIPIEHAFLVKDGQVIDPTMGISRNQMIVQMRKKMSKEYVKAFKKEPERVTLKLSSEYIGIELPLKFITDQYVENEATGNSLGQYFREHRVET